MPAGSRNARRRGGRKPKPVGAAGTRATPSPYRIDQRAAQTESPPEPLRMPAPLNQLPWDVIGIGAAVTRRPLPHHRAYGPYTAVRDGYASIPRIRTECGLVFRFQSSPRTAQPLPFPPLGLHPSAQKRSPVRSGYSAVCRPLDSWPTGLSFSFGPSAIVSGLAYPLLRLSAFGVPH